MPSQDKLFLAASVDSSNALTDLFDFVWPAGAALWNFKWQASGFLAACPSASDKELLGRFVQGSGINGVNVKRVAVNKSWEDMQQWFSRLLLSETCSLFEGWIEAALDDLAPLQSVRKAGTRDALDKKMQFPTSFNATGSPVDGSAFAVSQLVGPVPSPTLLSCFQPIQLANKKNSFSTIESLLVCYRVFKEARNDFVHHGGRASTKTAAAYARYAVETAATMGVAEKPLFPLPTVGEVIELSLRGVVGFSDVALRLIATYDQLITRSPLAEAVLRRKWREVHGGLVTLKPKGPARDAQITRLIRQCGFPRPTAAPVLFTHLNSQGLVA